jgi:hypothetical protein
MDVLDGVSLGDDGDPGGDGTPGRVAPGAIEVGIAPTLPVAQRAALLAAWRAIKAETPVFYQMYLAYAHSHTLHHAYHRLHDKYDYLAYCEALSDTIAYMASGRQYMVTRFLLSQLDKLLYCVEHRPDIVQRKSLNIGLLSDYPIEIINATLARMLPPNLNASQAWEQLSTLSAVMSDLMELREAELGSSHLASEKALVHAEVHDLEKLRETAKPLAEQFVKVGKLALEGKVKMDLYDARAYGYSLLLDRDDSVASVAAYRRALWAQAHKAM